MSFEKPYEGLRVVDMSQGVAGPYCAMLLARHGADVVKVEPLNGDWARMLAPVYGDHSAFSVAANTGKRSLAVNLKEDAGKAIVDRLIPEADVFLEGFRPGVIDRLGFSYTRLSEMNAALIYLSISGFGQVGPLREKPAMDPVLQAFTGFMAENKGQDGIPHRTPTVINDMTTALYAHQAVAAALYARHTENRGRRIDVSLMEASANLQTIRLMSGYLDGPYKAVSAPSGTFTTADGWIQMVIIQDRDFRKLCDALGLADLGADARFATFPGRVAHGEYLNETVGDLFRTKPSAHWRDILTAAGLQNEVVQTYEQFVHHPQVEATGLIAWMTQPGADPQWPVPNVPGVPKLDPGAPGDVSPRTGQHTREVLGELGFGAAEIDAMVKDGTVGV